MSVILTIKGVPIPCSNLAFSHDINSLSYTLSGSLPLLDSDVFKLWTEEKNKIFGEAIINGMTVKFKLSTLALNESFNSTSIAFTAVGLSAAVGDTDVKNYTSTGGVQHEGLIDDAKTTYSWNGEITYDDTSLFGNPTLPEGAITGELTFGSVLSEFLAGTGSSVIPSIGSDSIVIHKRYSKTNVTNHSFSTNEILTSSFNFTPQAPKASIRVINPQTGYTCLCSLAGGSKQESQLSTTLALTTDNAVRAAYPVLMDTYSTTTATLSYLLNGAIPLAGEWVDYTDTKGNIWSGEIQSSAINCSVSNDVPIERVSITFKIPVSQLNYEGCNNVQGLQLRAKIPAIDATLIDQVKGALVAESFKIYDTRNIWIKQGGALLEIQDRALPENHYAVSGADGYLMVEEVVNYPSAIHALKIYTVGLQDTSNPSFDLLSVNGSVLSNLGRTRCSIKYVISDYVYGLRILSKGDDNTSAWTQGSSYEYVVTESSTETGGTLLHDNRVAVYEWLFNQEDNSYRLNRIKLFYDQSLLSGGFEWIDLPSSQLPYIADAGNFSFNRNTNYLAGAALKLGSLVQGEFNGQPHNIYLSSDLYILSIRLSDLKVALVKVVGTNVYQKYEDDFPYIDLRPVVDSCDNLVLFCSPAWMQYPITTQSINLEDLTYE